MTKGEFMRELESLLSRLPQNEKRDALEYYSDYFAEAGITEDMLVPASVGTPAEIADTIIKEAIGGEDKATSSKEQNSDTKYYYSDQRSKDWNVNEAKTGQTNTGHENKDNTKLIVAIVLLVVFRRLSLALLQGWRNLNWCTCSTVWYFDWICCRWYCTCCRCLYVQWSCRRNNVSRRRFVDGSNRLRKWNATDIIYRKVYSLGD